MLPPGKQRVRTFAFLVTILVLGTYHFYYQSAQFSTKTERDSSAPSTPSDAQVIDRFDIVNERLVLSSNVMEPIEVECKVADCPIWYSTGAIQKSSDIADAHPQILRQRMAEQLSRRHEKAKEGCNLKKAGVLGSGGWCLVGGPKGTIEWKGVKFDIPQFHVPASQRIASELINFIEKEEIKSFNDFGAGVGQYRYEVLRKFPDFDWRSFDGAGNVVEYTQGFVKFFDLTIPLDLPKADWVLSLEVGEHVPNKYEAMVIRNLHHHNCKGIILSWAVLRQPGHSHINNHSNDYVIKLFQDLGYVEDLELKEKLRDQKDNYRWFTGSTMVFRRGQNSTIPESCKSLHV